MTVLNFDIKDVQRVVKAGNGKIILVHDSGVYLMPARNAPAGEDIAYAEGCDPRTDTEWYDTARDLVGGDDFGEHIQLDPAEVEKWKVFKIRLTASQLAVLCC